ncbi:hypothetical protein VMT65_31000 [Nocardia sp. CDC153]|uniref:hypothetical protein n=1 Tax=Nocardia sp. CDC153 TaxID=3112167 RepID=UPI002DB86FF8|nr:hypothetical protein [Nocardia sp. CDC153]MEC3957497.1 hypothetical protein [Nocardia sp. CDC153]
MKHCNTIHQAPDTAPDTVLDGVGWPGLTLLLAGVLTLASTFGDLDTGPGPFTGTGLALIAFAVGFTWVVIEHRRYRAWQDTQEEHQPRVAVGE